jgi:hypothetical protein
MFLFSLEQADPETDEVYAQMTLQPVNKVGYMFNLRICYCIHALVPYFSLTSFPKQMMSNYTKDCLLCLFCSMTRKQYWHQILVSNKTVNLLNSFARL